MSKPITGKITTSVWHQKRKNGDIYVWERQTQYIPETRKTHEISRRLVGKILAGSVDGQIVPTRPKRSKKTEPVSTEIRRNRVGASELLAWIGWESGISEDLQNCTDSGTAKKIETIAQFWLANQGDRLRRMEKWLFLHPTPYPGPITKDVYHALFEQIGLDENLVQSYFRARAARCEDKSPIAFDSSTVSTYSQNILEARQGFNKAGDSLNTVKLLTLYDLKSRQPIAFARQPENLADVAAIENAIKQLSYLDVAKAQIVTDKGYYSQANIGQMVKKHVKFLTAVSIDLVWVNKYLQQNKERLETAATFCPWDFNVHGCTVPVEAEFAFTRKRNSATSAGGDIVKEIRRLYLHLFLNRNRVTDDEHRLGKDLMALKHDVESGLLEDLSEAAQKKVEKYLTLSRVGRGGKLRVAINERAYAEARKDYGYFALLSNKAEDCFEALKKYRLREKIEEAFKDTKNRIDGHRTRVWDGDCLQGRMFCQFVGLGYFSFLHNKLKTLKEQLTKELRDKQGSKEEQREKEDLLNWLKKQSVQSLLDWLDCIELTRLPGRNRIANKRDGDTKRDRLLFRRLGLSGYEEEAKPTMSS